MCDSLSNQTYCTMNSTSVGFCRERKSKRHTRSTRLFRLTIHLFVPGILRTVFGFTVVILVIASCGQWTPRERGANSLSETLPPQPCSIDYLETLRLSFPILKLRKQAWMSLHFGYTRVGLMIRSGLTLMWNT